jgi:hypothetical protein
VMFLQGGIQDDMLLRAPKECGESQLYLFSFSLRKGEPSADGLAEGLDSVGILNMMLASTMLL